MLVYLITISDARYHEPTTLYMFRTVSPPIIRGLRLCVQHQVNVIQVLWLLGSGNEMELQFILLYYDARSYERQMKKHLSLSSSSGNCRLGQRCSLNAGLLNIRTPHAVDSPRIFYLSVLAVPTFPSFSFDSFFIYFTWIVPKLEQAFVLWKSVTSSSA